MFAPAPACNTRGLGVWRAAAARRDRLQQLDERDDQRALRDHRGDHPCRQAAPDRLHLGAEVAFDRGEVGLGRQIGLGQGDLLPGKDLGLPLR